MNAKVTILRKEVYDIPTPSVLTIGDGMYLNEIAAKPKSETKNLQNLVFMDDSIPAERSAKLVFREVLLESEETRNLFPDGIRQYEVLIIVSNKEYMDAFVDDMYFPLAVKSRHDLGCDTASFDIIVGDKDVVRDATISTCADGNYGSVLINKDPLGFVVNLYLDADIISEDMLKSELAYLFRCDSIRKQPSEEKPGTADHTRTYLVKLTFLCDDSNDTEDVRITVPGDVTVDQLYQTLRKKHRELDGSEVYDAQGRTPEVLLNEVCRENGWTWESTRYDLEISLE